MAKKNTIGLLERATDTSLYPQIPSIKPEIPLGNADVLRELYGLQSTRISRHTLTSSNIMYHSIRQQGQSHCLFLACSLLLLLTHIRFEVIKGRFLAEKECQKVYAAYAVNIDAC
jgi:hypothetical protein